MKFYQENIVRVITQLKTNQEKGLTQKDINQRLIFYGKNLLPQKKSKTFFIIFLQQFLNPLMFILLLASAISFIAGELKDAAVIFIASCINVVVGFFQEWKAEKEARVLKKYEETRCKVKRDGSVEIIDAKNLVPGDILILDAGGKIPADVRLTHVIDFTVDEALLTGEAFPVSKNTSSIEQVCSVGDRKNMAYAGTYALRGKAEGVIVATGQQTELGKIANLVTETEEEETPLQMQIKKFSWKLVWLMGIIILIIFIAGFIKKMNLHEIVNISLALAVAAIPEGLLIAVTTILAIGMHRMLKRKALVRHLVAAETLGSVSVICTDKTGTLTEGRMQVVRVISENFDVKIEHQKAKTILQNPEVKNIVFSCVLNNDAQAPKLIGHSTEIALLELARLIHVDVQAIKKSFPRITEIPFSSDLKYMATVHSCKEEELLVVKGAPEKIFSMSNNDVKSIDRFRRLTEEMAEGGLRPLCVAQKRNKKIDLSQKISDLTCIGLVGIKDPLRPQAIEAIKEIHNAGIRVVIVTGDHKKTATNIAQQVGISSSSHKILTGQELDKMSSQELAAQIQDVDVFARIDPHHKINIVRAWQQHGHSVAMTGDGVNDAPALKAADIGIALGSGSDVAHETSDMVLLDNNLSTIGAAVHEGRIVFDNIKKVIVYLMSDSFSEIVLIGMSLILGLPSPFLAVQIFWINLITDGFPDLALTVEPGEHGIMQEKPRQKTEPVVNSEMKTIIFGIGIITDIGLFAMYILLLFYSSLDLKHIRTIMFTGLAIDSLLYVFSVRSMRFSLFKINPFSNHWLLVAVVAGFFVQLSAIYFPPLQKLLSTISLGFFEWSIILGLALVKIIAIEATKEFFILRRKKKS